MTNEESIKQNPPRVMSVVQASIYLNISDRAVRELVNTGKLRCKRKGMTGKIHILKEWVDEYIDKEFKS